MTAPGGGGPGGQPASSARRGVDRDYGPVSDIFAALASPLRSAIIHRLTGREHTVAELVQELGASQPLISQHLTRLKFARLVDGERRGRQVVYRITDDHVAHIFLDAYRHSGEPAGTEGAPREGPDGMAQK